MNTVKRLWLVGMCVLLASCASVLGPRDVEVSQQRLQTSLERKFPLHQRVLELFEVTLTQPQVQVVPELDRVALTLDAALQNRFGGGTPRLGRLTLSGRLALDAPHHALLLRDTRIDSFSLDGMDSGRQSQLTAVANVLLDRVASGITVYTFQPDDLRRAGVQFAPTRIVTRPRAVVVTLEPVRSPRDR